ERQQYQQSGGRTGEQRTGLRAPLPFPRGEVEVGGQPQLQLVQVPQRVALRDVPHVRVDLQRGQVGVCGQRRRPHPGRGEQVVPAQQLGVPGQLGRARAAGELGDALVLRVGELCQVGELCAVTWAALDGLR